MQILKIESKIYEVRGQKIMLDFTLAQMYETETKRLNEAVKRNIERFPKDFMFQLTKEEWEHLRSHIETSNNALRSQTTTSNNRGGTRYLPYAFTEQGVAMLSSVLNSPKAIAVNIGIIRAFVTIRQYALTYAELSQKLKELEGKFTDVYEAISYLLDKDKIETQQKERTPIGFKTGKK